MTKEQAISIVTSCAEAYNRELLNKCLLFVISDKHKRISVMETRFGAGQFLHLTGLKISDKKLSASRFFKRCLDHKLSPDDFEFPSNQTTFLKLEVMPTLICKNLAANSVGTYKGTGLVLHTEKLAGGIRGCIGFVSDAKEKYYIPNTLLKADIRDYIVDSGRILITYRRDISEEKYSEIVYAAKKVDWKSLVPELHPMPSLC
ncbi:MAG: PBECR4 domain-containing protein [Lachnospiraceae bacterium]|nr:PBECR4 domain-containing protein [Lachnospiraceae bacterium]